MSTEDRKVRLSTGGSLRAFLNNVISEGVKSALAHKALTEKEKQDQLGSGGSGDSNSSGDGVDDLFGGGSDAGGDGEDDGDSDSSKTGDDETEKLEDSEVEPKDIVDKLNSIRSGKSFKDDHVKAAMEEYLGSLSKTERVALFAFAKGIAQIVTGEIPAQQAEDPSKDPSDVKMQKGDGPQKVVHKTPNVIKGGKSGGGGGKQSAPPAENTAGPAPITPRRR